jgi:plastocyanin
LACTVLAVACAEYGSVGPTPLASPGSTAAVPSSTSGTFATLAQSNLSATVQFGLPELGSGFPAPAGHDQSSHAADNLVPRTVVIDRGGTVTFNVVGIHQVAIYDDGTRPEDIDTSTVVAMPAGCAAPPLLIDDPDDRLALYATGCGPRTVEHTFPDPGRYLVICAFRPHFADFQMYGWVIVR